MEKKSISNSAAFILLTIFVLILIIIVAGVTLKFKNDRNLLEESRLDNIENKLKEFENNKIVEQTFSDDEIKKAIQEYMDLIAAKSNSNGYMLVKLGLLKENEMNFEDVEVVTNISYEEFKNKMLNYVTEEFLVSKFSSEFYEKDSKLVYQELDGNGFEFEVNDISKNDDKYICNGTIKGFENDINKAITFKVERVNNKCVISYCDTDNTNIFE